MYLLDTNVVSELAKPLPDARVVQWFDAQPTHQLHLSSVAWYELLLGIELLPAGRKKNMLRQVLLGVRDKFFGARVLAFEEHTASLLSKLFADAQRKGKIAALADSQIAATALQHGLTVVSRDVKPFQALGVKVLNPWLA
jgi:toxin FitB